ncbi:MAG: hypothetical protein KC731_03520, partial [Myxococcales bacterium]|nr:hypothetical protein [Myxococcales bacterium]
VVAALFALASLVPLGFSKAPTAPVRRRQSRAPTATHALQMIADDAYLRRLFAMVAIGAILITGIDYVFKAQAHEVAAAQGLGLGEFFARYYAFVNGLSLLFQLLVAPRIIRFLGVSRALLVMPSLLLVGASAFAATLGRLPPLLLKGTDGALRHSLHRTAGEILYLPLARQTRERFKAFAEAVGQRGGQAVASLLLLAITFGGGGGDLHLIAGALVLLAALWVATMVGLEPLYLERFRSQLRDGTLETEVDIPDLDLGSFELLVHALSSEDDREVLAALDLFESYGKTDLVPALILYHPSHDVVLRAFEIFARSDRSDVRRLVGRLLKHDDEAIRAAALRTMAVTQGDEASLRDKLADESPEVATTALVALVRAGAVAEDEAETRLRELVGSPRHALALARGLTLLPLARFAWLPEALLSAKDVEISAAVAQSLARTPMLRFARPLITLLGHRRVRGDARAALLAIGEEALTDLEKALRDRTTPRLIRRHLPRTISRFGSPAAAAILVRALEGERDERVLHKILRGLGRMRTTDPNVPIDRDVVLGATRHAVEASVTALHWRLTVGRIVAFKQEAMTPAAELLVAYLDEKREAAIQRAFRLLHVLAPSQEFRIIYDGLKSTDKKRKATSLELLSHVVPDEIRDGILALVEEGSPRARLRRAAAFYDPPGRQLLDVALARAKQHEGDPDSLRELGLIYADHLRAMLESPSDALSSIVAHHVAELELEGLIAEVRRAEGESSDALHDVASRGLGLFAMPPEPSGAG